MAARGADRGSLSGSSHSKSGAPRWLANWRLQSASGANWNDTNPSRCHLLAARILYIWPSTSRIFFDHTIFDLGLPFVPLFTELLIAFVGVILADGEAGFLPTITADGAVL